MTPDNSHPSVTPGAQADPAVAERVVLVADGDPDVVADVAVLLRDRYSVRTAGTADELIAGAGDDVGVVLVDPDLTDLSNGQTVRRVDEAAGACQVAALAAERPGDDAFDDYVGKPVAEATLVDTVDRLARRAAYRSKLDAYYDLVTHVVDPDVRVDEPLERRLADLEAELDDVLDTLDHADAYAAALDHRDGD